MAKLTLAAVRTLIIEQTKTLMDELKGLQGEMDRRMSAVEKKIERIDNSLLACQAGLSQPLTQETLSFADAVGHPQNSHPLQQTSTSTRSTTTSKKRLPPSTSQHVDPAKTLVVAKPADPIRPQNTMNMQTSLNERDRSTVPLIATAIVVSNGSHFVEAKTTEGLDELRNKRSLRESGFIAPDGRQQDQAKTRHHQKCSCPLYDADTILDQTREHRQKEAHKAEPYWPPGSDLDITQHLQLALDEVSIEFNTIVLLAGDLNAHHPDLSESISTNTAGRLLQRFATVNALTQVIQAPTRVTAHSSSCLDILLTNIPEEINFLGVYPGIGTSDHGVACVDLITTSVITHTEDSAIIRPRLHFNTHSTNWKTANDHLSNINWHHRFAACNVEEAWTLFKNAY
ncbi:hypothetical protein CAPTEDRAFT_201437 [Capitella teleta]|uniref:Endonuclease/exonuclease/phosphatase domain-containing protein n=1 Tax=Capitella teleta TaxID=283909 RepID=R7T3Z8_CAPTE|nr:hypothetical protein CAPTEDRAFT_201437 [Capitella teleta]|eukprot:ELT87441.1 hypothetical protein CAPTEDRAFT_201437 [Capitella teleta]